MSQKIAPMSQKIAPMSQKSAPMSQSLSVEVLSPYLSLCDSVNYIYNCTDVPEVECRNSPEIFSSPFLYVSIYYYIIVYQ